MSGSPAPVAERVVDAESEYIGSEGIVNAVEINAGEGGKFVLVSFVGTLVLPVTHVVDYAVEATRRRAGRRVVRVGMVA
jgi:hypothetical protein